jgi:hypothetical protein
MALFSHQSGLMELSSTVQSPMVKGISFIHFSILTEHAYLELR